MSFLSFFLSFSLSFFFFSLLGAQNLFFSGLNYETISRLSSYIKNEFLKPSRRVPHWALFSFFFLFFFFSCIFFYFLTFSYIFSYFSHFVIFSFIFFRFLFFCFIFSFSFIFIHFLIFVNFLLFFCLFLSFSLIFFHFLSFLLFTFIFSHFLSCAFILAQTGHICFDLDGNLIEDYNKKKTRKKNEMKACSEGRWEKREKISSHSKSSSTSLHVDIYSDSAEETLNPTGFCASCSAKMVQRHSKLGAELQWSAHADRSPSRRGEVSHSG